LQNHFDDATVIFADVVGFGKITARMKAYEIVACLNQLFSEFDRLAEDAGIGSTTAARSFAAASSTSRRPPPKRWASPAKAWRRSRSTWSSSPQAAAPRRKSQACAHKNLYP
jgi:class 3 adenylate cyclase